MKGLSEVKWQMAGIAIASLIAGLSWWHIWTDHRILHELVAAYQGHEQQIGAMKNEIKANKDLLDKKADIAKP